MLLVAGVVMGCGVFARPLEGITHLGIAPELKPVVFVGTDV